MAEQREEKTVKIIHFCPWCMKDFEVKINAEILKRVGQGERCFICPTCNLEC